MEPEDRRATSRLYVPQIGRGVACLLVAAYDGAQLVDRDCGEMPLFGVTDVGVCGVYMLLAISGLIISHAHRRDLDDPHRAPHYLQRRFIGI